MNANFAHSEVEINLIGNGLNLLALKTQLSEQHKAQIVVRQFRDALSIQAPTMHVFVFDYGIVITWGGASNLHSNELFSTIHAQVSDEFKAIAPERYHFKVCEDSKVNFVDDVLTIPDSNILTLLAVSHGLAQSTKLEKFEKIAESTIKDNAFLSESLAKTGKIPLTRKALSKLRGALFCTKSDILLHFNLLDTPEFFWEHPEEESKYLAVTKYLDLTPRVELLTMKLATINEIFDMIAAEQHHKHSSVLEWIIIILIAAEIVMYFGH